MDRNYCDIYITQSRKGPQNGPGDYIYVIEKLLSSGKIATLTHRGHYDQCSAHGIELDAIISALKRFNKASEIHIHSEHGWYQQIIDNGWILKWQQSGWVNKNNEQIAHKEKYCELLEICESKGLSITVVNKDLGEYTSWLKEEVKKTKGEKG